MPAPADLRGKKIEEKYCCIGAAGFSVDAAHAPRGHRQDCMRET